MILKADAKALEWRVKAALSNDKVAIDEILNREDQHTKNQDAFGLPSRLIAKKFVFRMIFADAFGPNGFEGPAYAYTNDPEFSPVSSSRKFWAKAVEKFYHKYDGMYQHSVDCIRRGTSKGRIELPNGRFFLYKQFQTKYGEMKWPITNMLNDSVQGFGADIMREVRINFWDIYGKQERPGILPICTVHDDIQLDVLNEQRHLRFGKALLDHSFSEVQSVVYKYYDYLLPVPMECEVKVGKTLHEKDLIEFDTYIKSML